MYPLALVCVEYGLWITHGSRVVLAVGALRVAWGALQCTQTIGKCLLGALMGAPGCGYVVVPAFSRVCVCVWMMLL